MRVIELAEYRLGHPNAVKLTRTPAAIPHEACPRIPRAHRIDWLMILIWCVIAPFTAGWFWWSIWKGITALVHVL